MNDMKDMEDMKFWKILMVLAIFSLTMVHFNDVNGCKLPASVQEK